MEAVDKHLGEGQAFLTADLGLEFCVNLGFPETTSLIKLFRYIEDHKAPLGVRKAFLISPSRSYLSFSFHHLWALDQAAQGGMTV